MHVVLQHQSYGLGIPHKFEEAHISPPSWENRTVADVQNGCQIAEVLFVIHASQNVIDVAYHMWDFLKHRIHQLLEQSRGGGNTEWQPVVAV